jgi:hypothetical protein
LTYELIRDVVIQEVPFEADGSASIAEFLFDEATALQLLNALGLLISRFHLTGTMCLIYQTTHAWTTRSIVFVIANAILINLGIAPICPIGPVTGVPVGTLVILHTFQYKWKAARLICALRRKTLVWHRLTYLGCGEISFHHHRYPSQTRYRAISEVARRLGKLGSALDSHRTIFLDRNERME